jgi:hypothetical protein
MLKIFLVSGENFDFGAFGAYFWNLLDLAVCRII